LVGWLAGLHAGWLVWLAAFWLAVLSARWLLWLRRLDAKAGCLAAPAGRLPWLAAQASWAGWLRWLALCCGRLAACAVWLFSSAVLLRRVTGRVAAQTCRAGYCASLLRMLLRKLAAAAGCSGWLRRLSALDWLADCDGCRPL